MFTKISTERNLGNIGSLEDNVTEKVITTEPAKLIIEETVRQNLTDVPDTREETEKRRKKGN